VYSDIPGDTSPNQKVGFGRFRESVSLQPLMISDIMAATSSSRSTASRRTASAAPCVAKVEEASHHVLVKALTEKVMNLNVSCLLATFQTNGDSRDLGP